MQLNDPPAIKANAKDRVLIFSVFAAAIFGWGASYVFRTTEISGKECYVYKVSKSPITSFVLKPPEVPAAEAPKCPAAPKCEEKPEEKIEESPTQEKPKTQKHRHRHRVRARWGRG